MNFIQRVPDGACLTLETLMRSVLPVNTMAIAMGLHARCGNEDTLWGRKGQKIGSVDQIKQLVRVANELGREVATGKEARDIYGIGTTYSNADETLARLGYAPNRQVGQTGFTDTLDEQPDAHDHRRAGGCAIIVADHWQTLLADDLADRFDVRTVPPVERDMFSLKSPPSKPLRTSERRKHKR